MLCHYRVCRSSSFCEGVVRRESQTVAVIQFSLKSAKAKDVVFTIVCSGPGVVGVVAGGEVESNDHAANCGNSSTLSESKDVVFTIACSGPGVVGVVAGGEVESNDRGDPIWLDKRESKDVVFTIACSGPGVVGVVARGEVESNDRAANCGNSSTLSESKDVVFTIACSGPGVVGVVARGEVESNDRGDPIWLDKR
ncbi:hypothetical protein J6590_052501 [Homalodisca vitripennis]|nr:hypothetical protein J6590_052501 [Homalodisca vitripennis]